MIARNQRALTLIELLIVVAIIAILAAGMIAYITVPPREQLQAATDSEIEMGLSTFFAKLVADAHNATGISFDQNKKTLTLEGSGNDVSAVYLIDPKDCLRRTLRSQSQPTGAGQAEAIKGKNSPTPANLLVRNVRRLEAAPVDAGALWRISVSIKTKDTTNPTVDRSVNLQIGKPLAPATAQRARH